MKRQPKVGDECWVVAWCIQQGLVDDDHPEYGGDPDKNEMRRRTVPTREDALHVAREVLPQDVFGMVTYWPVRFVPYDENDAGLFPHVGYWKDQADAEVYEGEEHNL